MISKMILSAESLATNVTCIRSLICVCSLMNQQVVRFGKVTATKTTDELFLGSVATSPTTSSTWSWGG